MRTLDPTAPPPRRWLPLLAAAVLLLSCGTSRASVILEIQSVAAASGSSGNTLDVSLMNTGPSAVTVGGFTFEISSPTPNILFTSANMATAATYVFNGNSFDQINSFPLTTATGQILDASDNSNSGTGTVVGTGATVGLGHIFFDVAGVTAPGPYIINFGPNSAATSLSDEAGNPLAFTTTSGTITDTGLAAVPEPSPFVLAGVTVLAGYGCCWVRRRLA